MRFISSSYVFMIYCRDSLRKFPRNVKSFSSHAYSLWRLSDVIRSENLRLSANANLLTKVLNVAFYVQWKKWNKLFSLRNNAFNLCGPWTFFVTNFEFLVKNFWTLIIFWRYFLFIFSVKIYLSKTSRESPNRKFLQQTLILAIDRWAKNKVFKVFFVLLIPFNYLSVLSVFKKSFPLKFIITFYYKLLFDFFFNNE